MLQLTSSYVELRGATAKVTKNGRQYALLNVENLDGEHYQLYCSDPNVVRGFEKGDMVKLTLEYNVYNGHERVSVTSIEKCN